VEDLYFQPKFAEAFRLGGFRLELHYHSGCAENEYEVRVIDLYEPALPALRLRTSECRSLAIGLRFFEAIADASNGDVKAERTADRLRPLLVSNDGPSEAETLDAMMKTLDRERQRQNGRIDAKRERVDCRNRERRLQRKKVA
jgi:hypothetical protein